jgi:hypothetical protein
MPIPSDPDYVSLAPPEVQAHSKLFRKLLAMNDDPYSPLSYSPEMIRNIEDSLIIPAEG